MDLGFAGIDRKGGGYCGLRKCRVWNDDEKGARFTLMDEWLRARGLQSEGPVGHANARLMRASDLVDVAVERLKAEPLIFLREAGSGCAECNAARKSVPPASAT